MTDIDTMTTDQINKLFCRYEARLGAGMTKTLGNSLINLYVMGVSEYFNVVNPPKLIQDLEEDPFINHAYKKDDPDAKVILGRIMLSSYQLCCLRDEGECPLTKQQMAIIDKFEGKKLSNFPAGWDAFIRPDMLYQHHQIHSKHDVPFSVAH